MFKLIGLAAGALGAHRAYQADRAGVSLDRAFKLDNLTKPIADLVPAAPAPKPEPEARLDPDAVMVPDWM